ncbi:MAG: hypothetical protein ACREBS_07790, partial [Nitrososphaerales archaeon]
SAKYRRMPIKGVCLQCDGPLQPSVTRGSVEKYLQLGLRLSAKYDVGQYLRSRFVLASEELATLFKPEGHQSDINDYFTSVNPVTETDASSESEVVQIQRVELSTTAMDNSSKTEENKNKSERKKPKPIEQSQTTLF